MAVQIIAELSGNHGGEFSKAKALVRAAAKAGADGIKLQTFTPRNMAMPGHKVSEGHWAGRSLFDLYTESYTPWAWHKPLFEYAKKLGMIAFSSAFCRESVDYLANLEVPYIKIASLENNDWPLIDYAATKAPLIISTGCTSMAEYAELTLRYVGEQPLFMLCASSYPADASYANVLRLAGGRRAWGYSDHTVGSGTACAAIAHGAAMIEKHITLDKKMIDGHFSDHDFARFVSDCRAAEASLGHKWGPFPGEMVELRRSLWVVSDISKGEIITNDKIKSLRPAGGLHPKMLPQIIGKKAATNLRYGDALKDEHVQW